MRKFVLFSLIFTIFLVVISYLSNLFGFKQFISPVPESTYLIMDMPPEFGAWISYWGEDLANESLDRNTVLKSVSPVWYKLDEYSDLVKNDQTKEEEIRQHTQDKKILIIPSISNDLDGTRISKLLESKDKITKFIQTLGKITDTEVYAGVDLDLETIEENQKDAFSLFVDQVAKVVHQKNKALSVTVHSKTGKNDWEGSLGQDWKKLAESADEIRIMVYDYHNSATSPGSITPNNYLKDVVDYALDQIPLEKIVIALPLYGYDWGGEEVVSLIFEDFESLANQFSADIKLEPRTHSKYFKYEIDGVDHEVWFEDKETLEKKINIVRLKGINKFYFWKLGGEDRRVWEIN